MPLTLFLHAADRAGMQWHLGKDLPEEGPIAYITDLNDGVCHKSFPKDRLVQMLDTDVFEDGAPVEQANVLVYMLWGHPGTYNRQIQRLADSGKQVWYFVGCNPGFPDMWEPTTAGLRPNRIVTNWKSELRAWFEPTFKLGPLADVMFISGNAERRVHLEFSKGVDGVFYLSEIYARRWDVDTDRGRVWISLPLPRAYYGEAPAKRARTEE